MAPSNPPSLPARKGTKKGAAGAVSREPPAMPLKQTITLEDGTVFPIAIPKGMPAAQAKALVDYLKSSPEAAKAAYEQAQAMLKAPGMAQAFLQSAEAASTSGQGNPEAQARSAEVFNALKDDPDMADMFKDMQENGPSALQKYWEDQDLMLKISAKLQAMNVAAGPPAPSAPSPSKQKDATNLFDAAKSGDAEAAERLLDDGQLPDGKNDRGITPLGIAVGFNRLAVVKLLLARGADVMQRDPKSNTMLHYAAGYGRTEVAQVLLDAGAQMDAVNDQGQKPLDVAALNRETAMVAFLKAHAAKSSSA